MKGSEALRAALVKLGPNGEHWTQGGMWRDANGSLACTEKEAVCWCAYGALLPDDYPDFSETSARFLEDSLPPDPNGVLRPLAYFNDAPETTFEDVKAKFLEAIALAEKEEALSEAQ